MRRNNKVIKLYSNVTCKNGTGCGTSVIDHNLEGINLESENQYRPFFFLLILKIVNS